MSQNLYDKIINHLVSFYILKPSIEPCLIDTNVATRTSKGTDYAIRMFRKYINKIKLKYDKFYVLKFDISKYFYNIDHNILKKILKRKIKDRDALDIVYKIIDSTNDNYINDYIDLLINKFKEKIGNEKIIEELYRLPRYKYGKGLPIGNMTSQILAIFYLNDLDHYIKEKLGIKFYIRYMDDGILIHPNKKYLNFCLQEIRKILRVEYKLELNKKTKLYSSDENIEFLGFMFKLSNKKLIIKVRTSTKKRFKKKIKKLRLTNYEKYKHVIASYNGHLAYANSKNLIYENLNKFN